MRVRPFRRRNDVAPGEDSFLDIVANLVGILVILVVVVGANAGSRIGMNEVGEQDQEALTELQDQVAATRKSAEALADNNDQLQQAILQEKQLADRSQRERLALLVQLESARSAVESRKRELSSEQQAAMENVARKQELDRALRETQAVLQSVEAAEQAREVIEHYPTPIAKTVFTEEIHFRLRNGRLAWVPMNELVESMKLEWREKALKLETADETTETVGPMGEFRLQYMLRVEETENPATGRVERTPRFMRFVMVPVAEPIGEPASDAFAEGSILRSRIDFADPERTTVSIWVYPDSFAEFNDIKNWLYERGFKTACWPLSADSPISGGPSGYRSTAQ